MPYPWLRGLLEGLISAGRLKVEVEALDLNAADIQLGAVELKDGVSDTRATVDATHGLRVDVERTALPSGAATEASLLTRLTEATFSAVMGLAADAVATAGSVGTNSAKLRYVTSALGTLLTTAAAQLTEATFTAVQGAAADAAVAAGAVGTLSAKLRRLTTDLDALLTKAEAIRVLLAAPSVVAGTLTNRSGTITTGGTAQQLAASNSARRYLFVQNLSVENLWINFTTTAVASQPSIKLVPGDSFDMEGSFVSTEAVSIIGATTASAFAAKEG